MENVMAELIALKAKEEGLDYGTQLLRSSKTILEWYYDQVDHYKLDRSLVHVAYNYFCRWLNAKLQQGVRFEPKDERIRLFFTGSLRLAIKNDAESVPGERDKRIRALAAIGRDSYEERVLQETEQELLHDLKWRLHPPTPQHFAIRYARLHPLAANGYGKYLYEVTAYQMENAIYNAEIMMGYKPSVLAFAAMLRAEEQIVGEDNMSEIFSSLQPALGMDELHVHEAMCALENWVSDEVILGVTRELIPARGGHPAEQRSPSPDGIQQI